MRRAQVDAALVHEVPPDRGSDGLPYDAIEALADFSSERIKGAIKSLGAWVTEMGKRSSATDPVRFTPRG